MLSDPSFRRTLGAVTLMGWVLVVGVVGGGLLGSMLDDRWDSDPWLKIVGVSMGFITGLAYIWRAVREKKEHPPR